MTTKFTEDHEWLTIAGDIATVGITAHAAEKLGELVFVELKDAGESFAIGDEIAVIESVKAASEIHAPVAGEIVESNTAIADTPTLVNDSPDSQGWFYKIKVSDAAQLDKLMDLDAYNKHIAE